MPVGLKWSGRLGCSKRAVGHFYGRGFFIQRKSRFLHAAFADDGCHYTGAAMVPVKAASDDFRIADRAEPPLIRTNMGVGSAICRRRGR